MKLRSRVTGLGLVLTVGLFGAAACGSDDDTKDDTESTTQQDDSTTESDKGDDADNGDKPSKEDVVAGYTNVVKETDVTGLPEDQLADLAECVVDEVYDTASEQTLQALADENAAGVDQADAQLFVDAGAACASQLG